MILLKRGATGPNVMAWQVKVGQAPDGSFGPATERATVTMAQHLTARARSSQPFRTDGVVDDDLWCAAGLSEHSERIEVPLDGVNAGIRPARQSTMLSLFGAPAATMTQVCQRSTSPLIQYSVNVGPFSVSGHVQAIASLKKVLDDVKTEVPDLHRRLGTAGMLCVRAVRGSSRTWSNHSFGTAIDITVDGQLDAYGDGSCQRGLLTLSRFFNREGWYWGAEFQREDSMHYECGEELVRSFKA